MESQTQTDPKNQRKEEPESPKYAEESLNSLYEEKLMKYRKKICSLANENSELMA